ncbi:hypothetical protein ACWC10_26005 [Streptomyces sp. NPDC001595]|uniref:hypothetical protein n=1 Tax=Streptomyces sp. NPDC001532 TaxID=3154520 RepID=UPI00331A69DA
MRTNVIRAGRAAMSVAGLVLAAGCGGGDASSARTVAPSASASASASSSPAPSGTAFGQAAVKGELDAAVEAAGMPAGQTEVGYPEADRSADPEATEKERKLIALATRLSPCVVSWSSDKSSYDSSDTSSGSSESDTEVSATERRQELNAMLSELAAQGWKKTGPDTETPVGEGRSYFQASYEKRGWSVYARHFDLGGWARSEVVATENACFDRLSAEEEALMGMEDEPEASASPQSRS